MADYQKCSLKQRPELRPQVEALNQQAWPEFMLHGDMPHWDSLYTQFPAYQVLFCQPADQVIAIGLSVPFYWDGRLEDLPGNLKELMNLAWNANQVGQPVNALSAIGAIVHPDHKRRGLSTEIVRAMLTTARKHRIKSFVAPVRPTQKSSYPLIPIERYIYWTCTDGSPFDPWMRVHWKLGAQILAPIPKALHVQGSVAEWEEWTGMRLPESGEYVVPGALQPVQIDVEHNMGQYDDPNVWMQHQL